MVDKKNSLKDVFRYPNRIIKNDKEKNPLLITRLKTLEEKGYLILENFIKPELLLLLKNRIKLELENNFSFEFPCLAQTKIDDLQHMEIINNYLRYTPQELKELGVSFEKKDVSDYNQLLNDFRPSTLKLYIPSVFEFLNLWLNSELIEIVENYMGIRPYLQEAYIRRNFPAKYKVMNHFWHRDLNNNEYLIKIFFFFTDCKKENGPHEYISGTIKDRRLDGKTYYTEEEIDRNYPEGSEERIKSIVKAGTVVIEDTRGLHRAVVPESGYRDLGFAVFTPQEFYTRWKSPLYTIRKEDYEELDEIQKLYIPNNFIT